MGRDIERQGQRDRLRKREAVEERHRETGTKKLGERKDKDRETILGSLSGQDMS